MHGQLIFHVLKTHVVVLLQPVTEYISKKDLRKKKEKKKKEAYQKRKDQRHTSRSIDSRASKVPFSLQYEDIK